MNLKKLLTIVAIVSLFAVSYANSPSVWEDNGIPIRQGSNIEWFWSGATIGEDKVIYVWSDTRGGDRDLYAQAINADGLAWNDGESVVIDDKENRQEDPFVLPTSDGCAMVAWIDFHWQVEEAEEAAVLAQKINSDGELMWEESVIVSLDNHAISLNMVPNTEGGAHIIWHDHRDGINIYGMHLNADGEPYSDDWIEDGLPIAYDPDATQHYHTFWGDGEDGAVLAWVHDGRQQDLHIKRWNAYGETLWQRELVADQFIDYDGARIQPFGEDAFGIAYQDRRDGFTKIYLQVVDLDGEDVWEEPIPVDPEAHMENYRQRNARVVGTTDGNFVVVWEDERDGIDAFDIYVQKFDIEGNRLWDERGVQLVEDASYQQVNPRMECNGEGGVLVVWEDAREGGHPNIDIYMQQVTEDGEIVWEENGRPVAQIEGEAFSPLAKYSRDGHLYVVWGDMRNGSVGLYSQGYDPEGEQLFEDNGKQVYWGLSGDALNHTGVVNGDYIYVLWTDGKYSHFGSQIYIQKLDKKGNILFERNGIPVTEHSRAHQICGENQDFISAVPHHEGGVALAWKEQREDFMLVYVQAIGPDGEKLWDPDGTGLGVRVTATDDSYTQDNPYISRKGEAYIVAFDQTEPDDDWNYPRDTKAQKIVNGNRMWGDEGVEIAWQQDDTIIDHTIQGVVDGQYIVWRKGDGGNAVVYTKRVDEDGSVAEGWDEYGLVVCDVPDAVHRGIRTLGTSKGLLVLWEDNRAREGTEADASIYGQLIDEDGEILWEENGLAIADYRNDQMEITAQYDDGHVYIAWRDARVAPGAQDIAFQKIDLEGNLLWGDPAPYVIRTRDDDHERPALVKTGNGVLAAWENNYGEEGVDLHMQLASAVDGEKMWIDEGEPLSKVIKRQIRTRGVPYDDRHAFMVWADGRSSGKEEIIGTYAQLIDMFLELSVDEPVQPVEVTTLYANYPNPFNPDTKISFALAKNQNVSLKVYNAKGQLVNTLVNDEYLERGHHSIKWEGINNRGNEVGSGVYFYKLESDDDSQIRKMLLLK